MELQQRLQCVQQEVRDRCKRVNITPTGITHFIWQSKHESNISPPSCASASHLLQDTRLQPLVIHMVGLDFNSSTLNIYQDEKEQGMKTFVLEWLVAAYAESLTFVNVHKFSLLNDSSPSYASEVSPSSPLHPSTLRRAHQA